MEKLAPDPWSGSSASRLGSSLTLRPPTTTPPLYFCSGSSGSLSFSAHKSNNAPVRHCVNMRCDAMQRPAGAASTWLGQACVPVPAL